MKNPTNNVGDRKSIEDEIAVSNVIGLVLLLIFVISSYFAVRLSPDDLNNKLTNQYDNEFNKQAENASDVFSAKPTYFVDKP